MIEPPANTRVWIAAGVTDLRHALIPGAGHFAQQEAPEATWKLIAEFAGL